MSLFQVSSDSARQANDDVTFRWEIFVSYRPVANTVPSRGIIMLIIKNYCGASGYALPLRRDCDIVKYSQIDYTLEL